MYRIFVIVGLCVLALVLAVTTCMIGQPPTDKVGAAQHTQ
jgi:hypothetical protein